MVTFAEQVVSDLPVFFNTSDFAERVTYTVSQKLCLDGSWKLDGAEQITYDDVVSQKQISAVFDFGVEFDNAHPKDTANILVQKADVPAPDYRHKIIRSGVTWYVARDAPQSGVGVEKNGLWEIKVTTNERYKLQAPW